MSGFEGFSPHFPAFLAELAANNERSWFTAHKADYQRLVQDPMRQLVATLAPHMAAIDPGFDTAPMGAAVSRVHRDVRFSRDKSPYRVNQWIAFKRPGEGWQGRPAFFLEFGPGGYRYGMGHYAAPPTVMKVIRAAILARPEPFQTALAKAMAAGFTVAGETYRRPVLPEGQSEAVLEWFRRKSPYLVRNRPLEPPLFSPALVDDLVARWSAAADIYRRLAALSSAACPAGRRDLG